MRSRILAVAAILLLALTLGLLFAHVLEMGPKLGYPPALYTRLNTSLYLFFGTVGAVVEVAALLACVALAVVVRHDRTMFLPTAVSALVQAAVLGLWFAVVSPVNDAFIAARPAIPPGFDALRARWETGHTIDAVLLLAALIVLLAGWVRPARSGHAPANRARHPS
ncbi:MAG: hypothetical protein ACRDRR_16280 [Pseudonocardiaceae bacterium]